MDCADSTVMAVLHAVSSDTDDKSAESPGSRAAKPRYQPRKATSLASRQITFEAQNFLSEAEKIQLQGNMHTPWEEEESSTGKDRQIPYLPLVLVSVMVCFAAYLFFRSQNLGPPAPEASAIAAGSIDPPAYEEKMITALKDFCESGDVSVIKGTIRHADTLGGIVDTYYRERELPKNRIIKARIFFASMFLSPFEASLTRVMVTFEGGGQRHAVLEWTGGEAKIDWGHWVCYNPVPVADFINPESKTDHEYEFRLMGRLPDKYRTSARFPEIRYGCVVLQDKAHNGTDFVAYVLRGTDTHGKVMAYLAGNAGKPLIVRLRRYSKEEKVGQGIEITELVAESWVRKTSR